MDSIEEKRVYGERTDRTELLVAADVGVVSVSASAGQVGEFGVAHRCSPRDVAGRDGRAAAATDEDVLVRRDGEFVATGFGPALAVGFGANLLAAGTDGRVARRVEGEWETVGRVDGANAIDGDLVAASDGVYRAGDDLVHVGLDAVRDVSASGLPLAATADGLYALGNGWMIVAEGDFSVVASDGDRAHAATAEVLHERVTHPDVGGSGGAGDPTPDGRREGGLAWRSVDLPTDERVVGVAYGECPYAVTTGGAILAPGEDGWRAHPLGLSAVAGIAAVR